MAGCNFVQEDCRCCAFFPARNRNVVLVDILPPGFGDANVPTEHKQSNRRN